MTTYAPATVELADDSAEAMFELFETAAWATACRSSRPTPERVDAMLAAATGDPDEVLFTLLPRAGIVTPAGRRHQRRARRLPAGDVPRRAHRSARARRAPR